MNPPLHSTSPRLREAPRPPSISALDDLHDRLCTDEGLAATELQWKTLDQFENGRDLHHEIVLSIFLFHQRTQEIIDFDSQHRLVARGAALSYLQQDSPGRLMLGRLRQLVTIGYANSLLKLWETATGAPDAGGVSATFNKLKALSSASEGTAIFPLSNPDRSFEESSRLIGRLIRRVTISESYQRLKACFGEQGESWVQGASRNDYLDPTNPLLNFDLDKMFLYSCCSLQSFNHQMFCPDVECVRAIVWRSRARCEMMWESFEENKSYKHANGGRSSFGRWWSRKLPETKQNCCGAIDEAGRAAAGEISTASPSSLRSAPQQREFLKDPPELAENRGMADVRAAPPDQAKKKQVDPTPPRSHTGFKPFLIASLLGFCIWAPVVWAMFFFF